MGKHGTHGHKRSTAFSNNAPGGLGYTLNKELKKQVKRDYVRSTRHTTDGEGGSGDLQSVTEVRLILTKLDIDSCLFLSHLILANSFLYPSLYTYVCVFAYS